MFLVIVERVFISFLLVLIIVVMFLHAHACVCVCGVYELGFCLCVCVCVCVSVCGVGICVLYNIGLFFLICIYCLDNACWCWDSADDTQVCRGDWDGEVSVRGRS